MAPERPNGSAVPGRGSRAERLALRRSARRRRRLLTAGTAALVAAATGAALLVPAGLSDPVSAAAPAVLTAAVEPTPTPTATATTPPPVLPPPVLPPPVLPPPVPPPPVPVVAPSSDTVCPVLFGTVDSRISRSQADAVMGGRVDLGEYGWFSLPTDPDWRDQATLDLAGNRYQDGFRWAVPLLRVGATLGGTEGQPYLDRFVFLLKDWVRDHPRAGRDAWINHPQYGGFRLGAYVCGVRELADPEDNAWLVGQAQWELAVQLKNFSVSGANNTMLNSQLAAFAAAQEVGTAAQRSTARYHVMTLVKVLTNPDGSDREGAPGYGLYLSSILSRAAVVLDAYGRTTDAATVRAAVVRQADFTAAATRPDRRLETIGDTDYQTIPRTLFPSTSTATWVATAGAVGTAARSLYTAWQAGYVFARSRWVAGDDQTSSFYSVRTGTQTPNAAHRHNDTTAVTYYSRGVSWVGDPGPYRYDTSATRAVLRTRAAHSALLAPGAPAFTRPATLVAARSAGGIDTTCTRDPAYEATARVQMVRCVYYVRALDALVVQDVVRPTAKPTVVTQQFALPPEVATVVRAGTGLVLGARTATGAARTARFATTAGAPAVTLTPFGRTYGVREVGRAVRFAWTAPAGLTSQRATVLSASGAPVSVRDVTTRGGTRALEVVSGGRKVVLAQGFSLFPKPSVSLGLRAAAPKVASTAQVKLVGSVVALGRPLAGVRVALRVKRDHRWIVVARVRTDAAGRFVAGLRTGRPGPAYYDLKIAGRTGATGWLGTTSKAVKVLVTKRAAVR